jgi:hypothetical protein
MRKGDRQTGLMLARIMASCARLKLHMLLLTQQKKRRVRRRTAVERVIDLRTITTYQGLGWYSNFVRFYFSTSLSFLILDSDNLIDDTLGP